MLNDDIQELCRGSKLFAAAGELYWRENKELWSRAEPNQQDRYCARITDYLNERNIHWNSVPETDRGSVMAEAVETLVVDRHHY
jgi:hypothetical protein